MEFVHMWTEKDTVRTYNYVDLGIRENFFTIRFEDDSSIDLTRLPNGFVGDPISFIIDVTKAVEGNLEIMVNNGDLQNTVDALQTGVYKVTFVPLTGGTQFVDIIFNGEALPGSPFTCNVVDLNAFELIGFARSAVVHRICVFTIHATRTELKAEVDISSPIGNHVPATIIEQPDGDYKVEWIPTIPGTYSIGITIGGRPIRGSPFHVNIFDASRVTVHEFYGSVIHEEAGFAFDLREAGNAEYEVKIIGPSNEEVHHTVTDRHNMKWICYKPTVAGKYMIYVMFGGVEIQGSPIIQEIGEGRLPLVDGSGLVKGSENHPATFTIHSQGLTGKPSVSVDGPQSIAKVSLDHQRDGSYLVSYIPVEVGIFNLQVKWNDKHVIGSPFCPIVVDARKVRIIGGWAQFMDSKERIRMEVDQEIQIPFDVTEAGPGQLSCEVRGPHGNPSTYIDMSSGSRTIVAFTPREEGIHHIYIYWNEHLISGTYFEGYAVTVVPEITKVVITGRGVNEAAVRQRAEFTIDGSDAGEGVPEVRLAGVKADIPVNVTHFGGGKYHCTYIPVIAGSYLLYISWFKRQLKGSPYKVTVINACFPEKVVVHGAGLSGGAYGRELMVVVDTKSAGPGEITAHCMGPHEVAHCSLDDKGKGVYHLRITPKEPGRHVLQIKYGGEHVLGSPYIIRIHQHPDASKVKVSGPGIENGILHTYQSRFLVETRGAGPGKLTVRVKGPKGAFNVEMQRESQKDRTILCRYSPHEVGLYTISVRWSGVDVPGSPFQCCIVDTVEDLEGLMRDNAFDNLTSSKDPFASNYYAY